MRGLLAGSLATLPLLMACASEPPSAAGDRASTPESVRIATFNIRELSTEGLEDVDGEGVGQRPSIRAAAGVIGRTAPDILVVQEIDHDYRTPDDLALNGRRLRDAYLAQVAADLDFPYLYAAPCNTGIPAGHDLNNDGQVAGDADIGNRGYGEDCYGFGQYPGQYSMVLLSRYPIDGEAARTFQMLRWIDMPNHHIPDGFYDEAELEKFRLSSKSHWDVPVAIGDTRIHLWISHPTPSVFDGDEDRNGRRNYDEIAFWRAYLDGESWIYDDRGGRGGYDAGRSFVVIGDLNSDPRSDGAFYDGRQSIDVLLGDPRFQDVAATDSPTASFAGGLRVDYLLPSAEIQVVAGGVYSPSSESDPDGYRLADEASDHRLVWIDVATESLR